MASGLNALLGFDAKPSNVVKNRSNSQANGITGAGNNLAQAMELLRIQRSVQRMLRGFSPQAKIIGIFAVTFILGAPINAFVADPRVSIGFFIFFAGIVLLLSWGLMDTRQVKFGMLLGWFVAVGLWIYIFYRRILQEKIERAVGKGAFICNPFGRCQDDGWEGTFDGLKQYEYTDPVTNISTPYIPGNKLKIVKPLNFSLCFWLRVSYNDWIKDRFKASSSPVIVKGGTLENATPSIWLDEKTNVIQFQASPLMDPNPVVATVNYPFDQWVHYAVVFQQDSMEVYQNGLLEKTMVLRYPVRLNKSNLYVGTKPFNEGNMPAEMVYLLYYNKSLTPEDINDLYKDQLTQMRKLPPPARSLDAESDPHCKECPQDCKPKETKKPTSPGFKDDIQTWLGVEDKDKKTKVKLIDTKKFQVPKLDHVESFSDSLCESFSNIDHLYHPF